MSGALDGLPAGLTARPLTLADSAAVTEVMAASELAVLGEVLIEEADYLSDWSGRPSTSRRARSGCATDDRSSGSPR